MEPEAISIRTVFDADGTTIAQINGLITDGHRMKSRNSNRYRNESRN